MLSKYTTLFVIIFLYFSPKVHAQNIVRLAQNQAKYDLENTVIDIFEDPTAKLTFEEGLQELPSKISIQAIPIPRCGIE
jgi:hypothetical protein